MVIAAPQRLQEGNKAMSICSLKHKHPIHQVKIGAVFERTGSFVIFPAIRYAIKKGH